MKKQTLFLALFILVFGFHIAKSNILNISPIQDNKELKTAATYFLPDYQKHMQGSNIGRPDGGGSSKPDSCSQYGNKNWVAIIPDKKDCKKNYPGYGLTCYGPCWCKPMYSISAKDCSNGRTPNDDKCDNLSSGCKDCPNNTNMINSGWSISSPGCSSDRLRTNRDDSCAIYYHCCASGFKATDHPSRPLAYDSNTQKVVEEWGGSPCKKAVDKECNDYNYSYLTQPDNTKLCTQVANTGSKTCYSCVDCPPEYQYNSSNCPSPGILTGKICNNKYSACNCPAPATDVGSSTCNFGCQSYHSHPCPNTCRECKPNPCIEAGYILNKNCEWYEKAQNCPTDANYKKCVQRECYESNYESSVPLGKTCQSFVFGSKTCYKNCDCLSNVYTQSSECANINCFVNAHQPRDNTKGRPGSYCQGGGPVYITPDCRTYGVSRYSQYPRYCTFVNGTRRYQPCNCNYGLYTKSYGGNCHKDGWSRTRTQISRYCNDGGGDKCELCYHSRDGTTVYISDSHGKLS